MVLPYAWKSLAGQGTIGADQQPLMSRRAKSMAETRSRRSCRVAMSIPIKIIGIDYRGKDFSEESQTVTVNHHGAKIRLSHQLIPDAEIRLLSHSTGRDSIFRVIAKVPTTERKFTYWGVENLAPERNIWGVEIPRLSTDDHVRA